MFGLKQSYEEVDRLRLGAPLHHKGFESPVNFVKTGECDQFDKGKNVTSALQLVVLNDRCASAVYLPAPYKVQATGNATP